MGDCYTLSSEKSLEAHQFKDTYLTEDKKSANEVFQREL